MLHALTFVVAAMSSMTTPDWKAFFTVALVAAYNILSRTWYTSGGGGGGGGGDRKGGGGGGGGRGGRGGKSKWCICYVNPLKAQCINWSWRLPFTVYKLVSPSRHGVTHIGKVRCIGHEHPEEVLVRIAVVEAVEDVTRVVFFQH